jgi:hypothetical protein
MGCRSHRTRDPPGIGENTGLSVLDRPLEAPIRFYPHELATDGVHEFLFVLGQPRFVGAVQMVINPIAIR